MTLSRAAGSTGPILRRYLAGSPLAWHSDVLSGTINPGETLIRVAYAGVNRMDLLQRAGRYPPPPGCTDILGVEVSGTVIGCHHTALTGGTSIESTPLNPSLSLGTPVMALLSGGGYATHVLVEESLCLPIPKSLSLLQGAAIPENWITAFQLCRAAELLPIANVHLDTLSRNSVLIHAGASGVGTALIQLAKAAHVKTIIALCGSPDKMDFIRKLGANVVLNRHDEPERIVSAIKDATNNSGVDVIFDCVGASRFLFHCDIAATDARWILFGSLGGTKVSSINLGRLLSKRIRLEATTLRSRSLEYKRQLVQEFALHILPRLASGEFKLFVEEFSSRDAEKALQKLEGNETCGKLVLNVQHIAGEQDKI